VDWRSCPENAHRRPDGNQTDLPAKRTAATMVSTKASAADALPGTSAPRRLWPNAGVAPKSTKASGQAG
jgi:hypothetical protein